MTWEKIGKNCVNSARQKLNKLASVKTLNNKDNIQTNADISSHKSIIAVLKKSKKACNLYSEESKKIIKINGGDNNIKIVIDPVDYTHFFS